LHHAFYSHAFDLQYRAAAPSPTLLLPAALDFFGARRSRY
jgi:hypothetical protein